jgi:DNA invertase Pin-like site-specific DNA recombinase
MNAALYARTSTDDGRQSPEVQLRPLRDWCRDQGHGICGEYVDQGKATSRLLPGRNALLRDARAGRFGLVLVHRWDRLARGLDHARAILADLGACGVAVVAVADPLPVEEAMEAAALESVALSARIRAGLDHARAEGRPIGRPPQSPVAPGPRPSRLGERLAKVAEEIRRMQPNHMV